MSDDVKDLLVRAVNWYQPDHQDLHKVRRRVERAHRNRRVTATVAALALFAVAAPVLFEAFRPSRTVHPVGASSPAAQMGDESAVSTVLRVVCRSEGPPEILTPVVSTQSDGVHIVVGHQADAQDLIVRQESRPIQAWISGSSGLESEFVLLVPPGASLASCRGSNSSEIPSQGGAIQPDEAAFSVVDPEGNWVPSDPVCGLDDRWSFYTDTRAPTTDEMTPAQAASALVPGVRPTDVVEQSGYLTSSLEHDSVRVVRDGEVIAWMLAHSAPRYWSFDGYACPDSGIG